MGRANPGPFLDAVPDLSGIGTYPANVCPIQCGGAASRSRPRRTILHNESGEGKRFLCQLGGTLRMSGQTRLLGRSEASQLERKEEMKPIHRTLSASSNGRPH